MKINNCNNIIKDESGSVAIITAVVLFFVLIGIAALAIDIGRLAATKNELQNAADAAALAGAGELARQYADSEKDYDENKIISEALDVAEYHIAANNNIVVDLNGEDKILLGRWSSQNGFVVGPNSGINPVNNRYNAVQVILRKNDISTFFAGILSSIFKEMSTGVVAVAALTGPGSISEGEMNMPFGLSEHNFPNNCGSMVNFHPTVSSCAAWHNFFDRNTSASSLGDKFLGFIQAHEPKDDVWVGNTSNSPLDGKDWLNTNFALNSTPDEETTPEVSAGDKFYFDGGTKSALFTGAFIDPTTYNGNTGTINGNPNNPAPFIALFDYFRYRDGAKDIYLKNNELVYDEDGNLAIDANATLQYNSYDYWIGTVPIYKDNVDGTCANLGGNNPVEILGFAEIRVHYPNRPPGSNIDVFIECRMTPLEERGGGGDGISLIGIIPNLVQ